MFVGRPPHVDVDDVDTDVDVGVLLKYIFMQMVSL